MEAIKLVLPTKEHETQVMDYKREFEMNGDSMDGTAGLQNAPNFDEWLKALEDNSREETVRPGLVPASTFLAIREIDNRLVGMVDIRHRLNDHLFRIGGHIGYSVRKSERRKGYAKEMLRLALEYCRSLNIQKVLVTCNKNNIASAKTIIANGGELENEIPNGEKIVQRYWITL
ncbi:MAG: GNAT family N-acetyltransferase [Clostridiaceae bacterium]|nr:GNAT family N-acetyltransferase [Clostridiaceae bacterium]